MELADDLDKPPPERLLSLAIQIREHLDAFERAMGEPSGGDAMWRHLDDLGGLLLRFEADGRFLAMRMKGFIVQDGEGMTREG